MNLRMFKHSMKLIGMLEDVCHQMEDREIEHPERGRLSFWCCWGIASGTTGRTERSPAG
jgi:hypothetical protein